jgi:hypothetical protein
MTGRIRGVGLVKKDVGSNKVNCPRCGAEGELIERAEVKITKPGVRGYCPHYWGKPGEPRYSGGAFGGGRFR